MLPPTPLATDSTRRFSDRVEFYIRSRPRYPAAVLDFFRDDLGLLPSHTIADIGSGTGFLSELFLANGNIVIGVEPNTPMRAAAETLLAGWPNFRSVDGTAEATGLPAHSSQLIVAGQAFHWFDPVAARREFSRILSVGGSVGLIWNERRRDDSAFSRAYHVLIEKHSIDHEAVRVRNDQAMDEKVLTAFFGPAGCRRVAFPNSQSLDFAGLMDRLASSSYMPSPGKPGFDELLLESRQVFDKHQADGRVEILYDTEVYSGHFS